MLSVGRQGQLYGITETTYGVLPSIAASNAMRHVKFTTQFDNKNRVTVMEKKVGPGHSTGNRGDRRKTASWDLEAILRSGAVLNTLGELDPVLAAGFGAKTNVTLSTTFSGTPTVSGGTIASAAGLVVGDFVLISCPDGKRRLRRVTTATTSLTWAPNLPAGQAPLATAACKGVTTYKLSTLLATSLSFAHYLKKTDLTAGLKRAVTGAVVDKLMLEFGANEEPRIKASGPAKHVIDAASQPGGFTTVGNLPPSGIIGDLLIGNTAMKFTKLSFEIANGMFLRMDEYGDDSAVEAFRGERRQVTLNLDAYLEDEATLYDLTEAGTNVGVFKQTGYTEGNCFAVYAPAVEFKVPNVDDPDEIVNAPFQGTALESADAANDELYLAIG